MLQSIHIWQTVVSTDSHHSQMHCTVCVQCVNNFFYTIMHLYEVLKLFDY